MHDSATPRSVNSTDRCADRALLDVMIEEGRSLWAVHELARELGVGVEDSIARLHGAGLIHRLGGEFVFLTRAAVKGYELAD